MKQKVPMYSWKPFDLNDNSWVNQHNGEFATEMFNIEDRLVAALATYNKKWLLDSAMIQLVPERKPVEVIENIGFEAIFYSEDL